MLVNPGVARFQHYAHETVAQIQESLHTFQRVVGLWRLSSSISLIDAMRYRVDFLLSQGKSLWRALRQRTDEAFSRQSHLRLTCYASAGWRLRDSAAKRTFSV